MIALTRFGFFVFAWSILFFTSLLVSTTHKDTSIFYEKFTGIIFFSTSLLLLVWIYVSHKDVTASKDLKESLYIMTLVSIFTSLVSFLGFC